MVQFTPTEELTMAPELDQQFSQIVGTLELVETDLRVKPSTIASR